MVFSREPRGARFQLRSPTKRHSLETSPRNTKKKKKKKRLSVLLVCRRTDSRADSGPGGLCPNTVRTGSSI